MDSFKSDFKMAREQLDQALVITKEDLDRLDAKVTARVRRKQNVSSPMRWMVGAFAAVAVLAMCLPPALDRLGGVAGVKERIASGIASIGQMVGREEPQVSEPPSGAYLIHDNAYYVPTEETVPQQRLGMQLGQVERIGDWALKREGDSNAYPPQINSYFELSGVDPKEKIVLFAKENSGDPGKFLVMRRAAEVHVDTSLLLHAKNDPVEVRFVLENVRRLLPDFYQFWDRDGKLNVQLAAYDPKTGLMRVMYGITGSSGTITVYQYPRSYAGASKESMYGPMYESANTATSEFEENGNLWKRYKSVYVMKQGETFYEVHIQAEMSEDEFRQLLQTFVKSSL